VPHSDPLPAARERIRRLREYFVETTGQPVRLVETHISWVLLGDKFAWKLKKPVQLPFLSFRTLASRRHYCAEELRVNRRFAPELYLDVVDVVQAPSGIQIGVPGRVVDVALRMRRFPDGALWSERLSHGQVSETDVDALAALLAAFHQGAPAALPDGAHGRAEGHARVIDRLLAALPASAPGTAAVSDWLRTECARLADHFAQRRVGGHVREGHGDLHLANIVQIGDRPTPFDAIEFDDSLRWIDPIQDIAFLVMDLLAHGAAALAWRFLNGWLDASGDYGGLPALRFHLVCRALVRAQVCALRERDGARGDATCDSSGYRALALALTRPEPARLAITHGLPGSGKTTAARRLAQAAGAIHVRSDIERKRLFGLAPLERSEAHCGVYDADSNVRTYGRLAELACLALRAGWSIVVDAAFLRRAERDAFAGLACQAAVPLTIIDCIAPAAVLRERVTKRLAQGNDASEADGAVLEQLARSAEPLQERERRHTIEADVSTSSDGAALASRWRSMSS
jgi:aminoglycoside phosphotransferase family enzyme/predicted kinase